MTDAHHVNWVATSVESVCGLAREWAALSNDSNELELLWGLRGGSAFTRATAADQEFSKYFRELNKALAIAGNAVSISDRLSFERYWGPFARLVSWPVPLAEVFLVLRTDSGDVAIELGRRAHHQPQHR